jgi:hypothetical protein
MSSGLSIALDGLVDPIGAALRVGHAGVELAVRLDPGGTLARADGDVLDRTLPESLLVLLRLTHAVGAPRAAEAALDAVPEAPTVVLTGPHWPRDDRFRYEGHVDAPNGPPAQVPYVYESFTTRFGWDRREPWRHLPGEVRHNVRALVLQAHLEGRKLRFTDVPEHPRGVRAGLWRELRAAGVDFIASPRSAALARFLRSPSRHAASQSRYAAFLP